MRTSMTPYAELETMRTSITSLGVRDVFVSQSRKAFLSLDDSNKNLLK